MDKIRPVGYLISCLPENLPAEALRLAVVLGIIQGHEGNVRIYSELGKGTSFKVLFPALDNVVTGMKVKTCVADIDWRGKRDHLTGRQRGDTTSHCRRQARSDGICFPPAMPQWSITGG
jgi:hypothetical protein